MPSIELDGPMGVALDKAVASLASIGAVVTARSSDSISGYVLITKQPNTALFLLLLLFTCVGGVLYWFIAKKQEQAPFNITLSPTGGDTLLVTINGVTAAQDPITSAMRWIASPATPT